MEGAHFIFGFAAYALSIMAQYGRGNVRIYIGKSRVLGVEDAHSTFGFAESTPNVGLSMGREHVRMYRRE